MHNDDILLSNSKKEGYYMIQYVDIDNASELDQFVRQHEKCHFMQTSYWGKVKSEWTWYGIIYRDTKHNIKGTMALLSKKLKWPNSCMLYAPRGPIVAGGDIQTLRNLIAAAKELACRLNAVVLRVDPMISEKDAEAEFLRQEFVCDCAEDYSLFQPRMCYVMNLQGLTPKTLEAQYHRSTRCHLNYAKKQGVEVEKSKDIAAFYALMQKTAHHNGFTARSETYFEQFLQQLGNHAQLYLAKHDDKVIGSSIAVFYGNRGWYMYGASDPANRKVRPNELLQWNMQLDAIKNGCKWFDLRGVEGYPIAENPKLGLHQFKQGFSAQFTAYAGQFDYVLRPIVWKLLQIYSKIHNS